MGRGEARSDGSPVCACVSGGEREGSLPCGPWTTLARAPSQPPALAHLACVECPAFAHSPSPSWCPVTDPPSSLCTPPTSRIAAQASCGLSGNKDLCPSYYPLNPAAVGNVAVPGSGNSACINADYYLHTGTCEVAPDPTPRYVCAATQVWPVGSRAHTCSRHGDDSHIAGNLAVC